MFLNMHGARWGINDHKSERKVRKVGANSIETIKSYIVKSSALTKKRKKI